jgi:isopenicillin N synthase-like dioxygenase
MKINKLGIDILKMFFRHFSIAEVDYNNASGGITSNKGSPAFAFHHYRGEKNEEGLPAHKDFGHLTLLYINKLGLQFKVNNEWVEAAPIPDYLVVNVGRTLENLINDHSKLIAPIHRVIQCSERVSFAAQLENNLESPLYKKQGDELVVFHESCNKFMHEIIASKNYL